MMPSRPLISALLIALLLASPPLHAQGPKLARVSAELNISALPAGQRAILAITTDVNSGYHAQSHKPLTDNLIPFEITLDENPQIDFGPVVYPTAELHEYPALGRVSVYTGKVVTYVPVQVKASAAPGPIVLKGSVGYQICNDRTCFAPEKTRVEISTTIVPASEPVTPNKPELFRDYVPPTSAPAAAMNSAQPPAAQISAGDNFTVLSAFGAALVAGLLFNIMPCVLPVLPLKAVGFYEASQHNRSRSFALGLVFSLGLISVFAVLALFVLVLRLISWGEIFSKAWFMWPMIGLLVVLSFGLLGAWNFALPLGVYRFEPRHDTFSGNFFWGALGAILATPCTAPLLPPVMAWAAAKPAIVGVPAMLMVGVGMALPYLILSAWPELARKLPRSGPWTELFKQMMGFLLLASAAYFGAGRIIDGPEFWWIVVAVVAVANFYLVGRTAQLSSSSGAVAISAVLAVIMLGGTVWWTATITGLTASGAAGNFASEWEAFSEQRFEQLRQSGKPVLVKFTANWCGTCQVIEGTVYRSPQVWQELKKHDVSALKVDFSTDSNAPGKKLLLSLNPTGGIPLTAIFGLSAGENKPIVLESLYTSQELLKALDSATPPPAQAPARTAQVD